ncbi:MAG: hypothetical protein R3A47_03175 [Polyangiales bacterium]
MRSALALFATIAFVSIGSCSYRHSTPNGIDTSVPLGKLPEGVSPTSYALDLEIDPVNKRIAGNVSIELNLDVATNLIWAHSENLNVTDVLAGNVEGSWQQVNDEGVAKLELAKPVGPGTVMLKLRYDGKLSESLEGLYQVVQDQRHYAFLAVRNHACAFRIPMLRTSPDSKRRLISV